MTYMTAARSAALMESHALRGYAHYGHLPKCAPVDLWAEWERQRKRSSTTFSRKTAA